MTLADAIEAVDRAANDDWRDEVDYAIRSLASLYPTFTSDDIWAELSETTHEHRAMGPRILAAVRAGVITYAECGHCGTYRVTEPSRREESHGKLTTVYRSLIFKEIK